MKEHQSELSKADILVVDDTPDNLRLLMGILAEQGYKVHPAPNGALALNFARSTPPDIILLDIKMPDMDGYAVCEQLKVDESTRDIPVIFISALNEVADKVKGFAHGGVDFITKPFQAEEVLARVKTHLTLRRLQKHLQENNLQLQQEIAERKRAEADLQFANDTLQDRTWELSQTLDHLKATQQQLIQAGKMAALGQLVAGIAHEINTPVGVGVTAASFLEKKTQEILELYAAESLPRSGFEKYLQIAEESASTILSNLQRVAGLIQNFKQVDVERSCETKRYFNLKECIDGVVLSFTKTQHLITITSPEDLYIHSCLGALMQITTHLIENSLNHGFENIEQGQITIEVVQQDGSVLIRYSDNGKGMTEEQTEKIFDPFFTTKRFQRATGLGMHIVYNLVTQTLGGHIECQSKLGHGTRFIIQIPHQPLDTK